MKIFDPSRGSKTSGETKHSVLSTSVMTCRLSLTESEVILELLLADPDGLVRGDVLLISVGQSDSPPLP